MMIIMFIDATESIHLISTLLKDQSGPRIRMHVGFYLLMLMPFGIASEQEQKI